MKKREALLVLALACLPALQVNAEEPKPTTDFGKFSGLAFGDGYWIAQDHREDIEGESGFWFRRIYLTWDKKISEGVDVRARLEANSTGDFTSTNKLEPYFKDLYVRYQPGQHGVYAGLSSTPTFELLEELWGYRPVEKTPLDLQKMADSRDNGLALKGPVDDAGQLSYHLMLGNGSGVKDETNEGKAAYGALTFKPTEGLTLQVYADYTDNDSDLDTYTMQGIAAYNARWGKTGVLYAHQNRGQADGADDLNLDVASIFAVIPIDEQWSALARVDRMFDANPKGNDIAYLPFDPTAKSTLAILGFDYAVAKDFHVVPNIEVVLYDGATAEDPDTDIIPRITAFVKF